MLIETLWRTPDHTRHFIIPDAEPRPAGLLALCSLAGDTAEVDPAWAARFEVSEAEARAWAEEEFGFVLEQMRCRIDAKLARTRSALDRARHAPVSADSPIAPDAVPAMVELARKLPRAIIGALSGDAARVAQAGVSLRASEQRLGAAGIDVAPALGQFADRLAALRDGFDAARAGEDAAGR